MRYNHFAVALFDLRKDPPASLLITFIAGLLLFGVGINFLYDLVNGGTSPQLSIILMLVFLAVIAVLAYWIYFRSVTVIQKVSDATAIAPMRWIITSVSPYTPPSGGKPDNFKLFDLLTHHASRVERIYLVGTFSDQPVIDDQGVEAAHTKLIDKLEDPTFQNLYPRLNRTMVHKIPVKSADSAEECFAAIDALLGQIGREAIPSQEIVVDVTDGRKPMSIGLALAAIRHGCRLSYLSAERDADGLPRKDGKQIYIELTTSVSVGSLSVT